MRSILAALLAAALLIVPVGVAAQDPTPTPTPAPNLCGDIAHINGDIVDVTGHSGPTGECAIADVNNLPAWEWFDATITLTCTPATGSGTSKQVDGFYLWGTRYDDSGAIISQGYVGPSWVQCSDTTRTQAYHLQLVLQGSRKTIVLVTQRRVWPYGATKVVGTDQSRDYIGTVNIH